MTHHLPTNFLSFKYSFHVNGIELRIVSSPKCESKFEEAYYKV
jgi:hypothetical protein